MSRSFWFGHIGFECCSNACGKRWGRGGIAGIERVKLFVCRVWFS